MIEIFSIVAHILIITIFCYTPNFIVFYFNQNKKTNPIYHLEIGIIVNIFLLLILSFVLKKNDFLIFYIMSSVFLLNLFFCLKNFYENIKNRREIKYYFNPELIFLFFLVFVLSVYLSNNLKIGWDAQNYWLVKKLVFTNGGDIFDLKNTPRDDYPYLGSFLWFFYSKISILGHEYFGRIFYIYLFLISILSICKIINTNFLEYFFISLSIIFLIFKIELFNGYQEIINFSLIVILMSTFYKTHNSSKKNFIIDRKFLLIFANISILFWVKSEGTVLVLIFLLSLFLLKECSHRYKILIMLSFISLLVGKYYIFSAFNLSHEIQKGNYEYFKIENFFDYINFNRILLVLKYFIFSCFEILIFPLSIIFLFILTIFDKKNKFYNFLFYSFIFSIGFVFLAFLLSSFPLEWVLKNALNRITFQISGFFIILFPLFYDFFLRKKYPNKYRVLK